MMTNEQAAIKLQNILNDDHYAWTPAHAEALRMAVEALRQASYRQVTGKLDCISRAEAIDAIQGLHSGENDYTDIYHDGYVDCAYDAEDVLKTLPSAQPERTCVNCGRTANNGGWYADGRTRCPIEEHYALPKDGYCHLWEKRNVTDDDYPERREE